jgi:hypothetical protein
MIPSKEQLVHLLKELGCDPKVENGHIAIIDYAREIAINFEIDITDRRLIITTFFFGHELSHTAKSRMPILVNLLNRANHTTGIVCSFSNYSVSEDGIPVISVNFPLWSSKGIDKENFHVILTAHIFSSSAVWEILDSKYFSEVAPMEEVIVFYLEQLRNFANQAKSA